MTLEATLTAPLAGARLLIVRWQIVGRHAEVAAAAAWLRENPARVVWIEGEPGIGKSTFADTVIAALGRSPVVVRGFETMRDQPFGSLAAVGHAAVGIADPGSAYAQLRALLTEQAMLLVDDAQWVDDASAAVCARYIEEGWGPAAVTLRDDASPAGPLAASLDHEYSLIVRLGGLTRSDIDDAAAHALGVTLDSGPLQQLVDASLGNPMLLREFLATVADREQRFDVTDATYANLPRFPETRIGHLLDRRLDALSAEARSAVDALAVANWLPRSEFEMLLPSDRRTSSATLADEMHALIEERDGMVHFRHSFIRSTVRASLSPIRRFAALEALLALGDEGDDLARRVVWMVDAGREVGSPELLQAAQAAFSARDPSCERLARAAIAAGERVPATLMLVRALRRSGSPERFDFIDDDIVAAARPGPERLVAILTLAGHRSQHDRDPSEALRVLAEGETLETDAFSLAAFAAARSLVLIQHKQVNEMLVAAASVVAQTVNPMAVVYATEHLVIGLALSGDPEAALAARESARSIDPALYDFLDVDARYLDANAITALRCVGRFDEAKQEAESLFATWHDSPATSTSYSVLGLTLFEMGDIDRAVPVLERGRMVAERAGLDQDRDPYLVALIAAHSMRGDREVASDYHQALLSTSRALDIPSYVTMAELWMGARGWVRADRRSLRSSLELLAANGLLQTAAEVALVAAIMGIADPTVADLAYRFSERPNPMLRTTYETIVALVDSDYDRLLANSVRFADVGRMGIAAEIAAAAARVPGISSSQRLPAESLRSTSLAAAPGWVVIRDDARSVAHRWLTPRESEIADLAAAGASSAAIAEQLAISPRTVANALQRVYAKLNISRRTDLEPALAAVRLGRDRSRR